MAAAAAVVDPGLESAFQTSCEAVAGLSVAVLDEKQPERDWHRTCNASPLGRCCHQANVQGRAEVGRTQP
jgi:hypothetical protein